MSIKFWLDFDLTLFLHFSKNIWNKIVLYKEILQPFESCIADIVTNDIYR